MRGAPRPRYYRPAVARARDRARVPSTQVLVYTRAVRRTRARASERRERGRRAAADRYAYCILVVYYYGSSIYNTRGDRMQDQLVYSQNDGGGVRRRRRRRRAELLLTSHEEAPSPSLLVSRAASSVDLHCDPGAVSYARASADGPGGGAVCAVGRDAALADDPGQGRGAG